MKKIRRLLSLLLSLALCCGLLAPGVPAADEPAHLSDSAQAGLKAVWTHDAIGLDSIKTLLNAQTLHPQRTGWDQLDALLEQMISQAPGSDACSRLWYMYNWLAMNVTYSWAGYGYTYSSVAAYNSFRYDYLKDMTFEPGLEKSVPDDMANRTWHILTTRKGVCYDYAIAMAVLPGMWASTPMCVRAGFGWRRTTRGSCTMAGLC